MPDRMTRAKVEAMRERAAKAPPWTMNDIHRLTDALLEAWARIEEQDKQLDALREAMNPQDMAEALAVVEAGGNT